MMTVKEVCTLTGVSARTLHYYDSIGLLKPAVTTDAGYRLYDEKSLERLQDILLFRELEFELKEIKRIVDNPEFDRQRAIENQIELLTLKRDRLDRLIDYARKIKLSGGDNMSFEAFDDSKIKEYTEQAKKQWGDTEAYREYEKKAFDYSDDTQKELAEGLMKIFGEFGEMKDLPCESDTAQQQVKKLQNYISEHYYTCTNEILYSLGQMYAGGGEMTENIDRRGGNGTARFSAQAIDYFCCK